MGLGVSWYRCPDSPLGFYLVPEQLPLPLLPLWGFAPLTGASACLSSLLAYSWGWVGGVFATSLGFLPCICSSSGPAACAAFPAAGSLGVFSGHRVSVLQLPWWRGLGLQPFPSFSGLLLLRLLAGVVGVLHPVSGCSSCGDVCLVCRWVTLLPFPYLRVGMLLA